MTDTGFRAYRPWSLRLWHWLDAAAILGLLATVLLRKTLLSWRTNAALFEARLADAGFDITPELAKELAVAIRDPLWEWHIRLGVVLALLLVGRVVVAAFVEKRIPGVAAVRTALRVGALPAAERGAALHRSVVQIGYAVFYLATLFMVLTGLALLYREELALSKDLAGAVKEAHELAMWFFVGFAGLHVVGVVVAEHRGEAGIVSDMVSGGDRARTG